MKILSIGGFSGFGKSNTCLLRNQILKSFGAVDMVDTTSTKVNFQYRIANKLFRLGLRIYLPDLNGSNDRICELAKSKNKYDLVWIDKGIVIKKTTFETIRKFQPQAKIIGYSPDWMGGRHNQSQQFIESMPFYDCYVTTKSYSVKELKNLGARDVLFIDNAYQEGFHMPYTLSYDEHLEYDSIVSFIGSWEKERSDLIEYIASHGVKVSIWGSGPWHKIAKKQPNIIYKGGDLQDVRYCKALSASKISLCFLRKINKDLQTTRSIEIPACGSMMLAERTTEHQAMFTEDLEAVYFSSPDELLQKCLYYTSHEEERSKISLAGHNRCLKDDYSYSGRIRKILNHVFK